MRALCIHTQRKIVEDGEITLERACSVTRLIADLASFGKSSEQTQQCQQLNLLCMHCLKFRLETEVYADTCLSHLK